MSAHTQPPIPRLTVITPVLDGAPYVRACLENVAAQDCPACEHLVVDGGSTDGTLETVREFESAVPHVRLVSRPGLGQSPAMNLGVELARGGIVGFLNVDDFYEPGTLPRVLELFTELPEPALLVGNCRLWMGDELFLTNRPSDLRLDSLLLGPDHCPFPYNPSAYFYHRSLHERIGPYDEGDEFAMDLDFLLRAVPAAHAEYRDELWGNVRLHPRAKTQLEKATGQHDVRLRAVLERHRRRLPWRRRSLVRLTVLVRESRARVGAALGRG